MTRFHASTGTMSDNDPIKTRYDNAIKTLKEISKGLIALGGTPTGEAAPVKTASNNVMMTIGRHDWGGQGW